MSDTSELTLVLNQSQAAAAPGFNEYANVQVQNDSQFVLSVLAGGQQFTVQAFTATTLPLADDSAPVQVDPILDSLAATDNNIYTATSCLLVWLLQGEGAPMQDGPLTAAAVAAAVTGSINIPGKLLLSQTFTLSPAEPTIDIPDWCNSFIMVIATSTQPTVVTVDGATSGLNYYDPWMGFKSATGTISYWTYVVPMLPGIDDALDINFQFAGAAATLYAFASNLDDSVVRYSGLAYDQPVVGQDVQSPATALGAGDNTRLLASISGSGYAYQLRQLAFVPTTAPTANGSVYLADNSSLPANVLGVAVFPYSQTVDLNANTDNEVYVFNETSESVYVSLYYDVVPVFAEPVG
jgi:hypothetical protein